MAISAISEALACARSLPNTVYDEVSFHRPGLTGAFDESAEILCSVGVFNRSVTTIHSRSLLSSFLVSTVCSNWSKNRKLVREPTRLPPQEIITLTAVKNFTSLLTLAFPAVKFHNSFVIAIDRTLLLLTFLAYCSARKWFSCLHRIFQSFSGCHFISVLEFYRYVRIFLSSLKFSLWPGRSESWRCTCASLTGL